MHHIVLDRWSRGASPLHRLDPRAKIVPLLALLAALATARHALPEFPAPVVFDTNPVGRLTLLNGENGVRLLLSVTGPVTEDIMVFGQAPCSAGRMKRRNGGLPGPAAGPAERDERYHGDIRCPVWRAEGGREGVYRHPSAKGWLGGR